MGNARSSSEKQQQEISTTDIKEAMEGKGDMDHVDDLIKYIDQLIRKIDTGGKDAPIKPTRVDSCIKSGGNLIDKLSQRLTHVFKKPSKPSFSDALEPSFSDALDRETRKVVISILDQAQPIPYVGMVLSIIAHLLERAERTSSNKDECLHLLSVMSDLAKHMKDLDIHLHRDKLNDTLHFIVNGTLMCAQMMEHKKPYRYVFASTQTAYLEQLKSDLERLHRDLNLKAVTKVLKRLPTKPVTSQRQYQCAPVGIEEAQKKVIELLRLEEACHRVVVIYGVGGIGKTTLATAVFSSLNLEDYRYCRVDMEQDSSHSDLQRMQKQILYDVFDKNLTLNSCTQGQQKLSEAFEHASKPVFLFLDNALKETDIKTLLPIEHLSHLHVRTRIFVTTRNAAETNIFKVEGHIQVYPYRVDTLPQREAKRLLYQYALGDADGSFDQEVNINGLLEFCEGIPLVLRIVGFRLHYKKTVTACNEILEYFKNWRRQGYDGGGEDVSHIIVDFVYGRLKEHSKDAFLDMAFFFYDWERSKVAQLVGESELKDLEEAALVTTFEVGNQWEWDRDRDMVKMVKMHDIVRARGRKLSNGTRIADRESLYTLLSDPQKLQQTRGIWLHKPEQLSLDELPIDLSKSKQLVYFQCLLKKEDTIFEAKLPINIADVFLLIKRYICLLQRLIYKTNQKLQLPESLRLLYLYAPLDLPVSLDIYGHLISLKELKLTNITFENFERSIRLGNFSSLKILKLYDCSKLERLPENFGNLSSLETLLMNNCSLLERLPKSFGNLSFLQTLKINDCEKMRSLSDKFGQLKCLEFLSISNCKELKTLPDDLVKVTSLVAINAYGCAALEAEAMDILIEIRSLMFLQMGQSPMLIQQWEQNQPYHPLIGAAINFEGSYPYEEIMSTMFFNGWSRFVQLDGEGPLAGVTSSSSPDVGVKMALLFTACDLSDELRQTLVASSEFQIIYVDVVVEETSSWMEERDERIRKTLQQLPKGSRAWTSPFYKSSLLFAYSLWKFTRGADTSIVSTTVVDEEGRRKLSPLEMMFPRAGDSYSRPLALRTLFSPLSKAAYNLTGALLKKIVLRAAIYSEKTERLAIKLLAGIAGVESIAVDLKDQRITVVGDMDPVYVAVKLRKIVYTDILSVGPARLENDYV